MRKLLLVLVVAVGILAAAGAAVLVVRAVGHRVINQSITTTTAARSSIPTVPPPTDAGDAATVKTGCGATSLMNDRIEEAIELHQPNFLNNVATGPTSPWYKVTAMEIVGADPKFRPLAGFVRGFIQAFSVARANGDLTTLEESMGYVIASCQTLGQSTHYDPIP